jgi:phosphoserine aminotransferase
MSENRIYNFSAGPSMLPLPVLQRASAELCNYNNTGRSVMEMSHRSKPYEEIITSAEALLREVMGIPDTYTVLFLQGGATGQFAGVPLNMMTKNGKADYIVTGQFSQKAYEEAQKYGKANIAGSSKAQNFTYIPAQEELTLDPEADYVHICENNTIYGSKWPYLPNTGDVPLVADQSSCILSEPIDVTRYGVIYAGAQKNLAPAGVTVVTIRNDLIGTPQKGTPTVLSYETQAKSGSMYNTPPSYSIYMIKLVLEHIKDMGGLSVLAEQNRAKAAKLYATIDASKLFTNTIRQDCRSIMNVTFSTGSEELDAKFCKEAAAAGLASLKGHRAVGGMRASIYNAMPSEGVDALIDFMARFEKENA